MKRILLGILCASLLGMGCGGDDDADDDGSKPAPSEPVDVKKMITAEDGGEVKAGKAALSIPAGALSDDTEISVKSVEVDDLPDADNVASDAFDFGPDGTTFEKPVTLTLEFSGKAPKGMEATLAWLDGKKWVALEDSKVVGGKVEATTTHFTTFSVVWMSNGDGTGTQTAGACDDAGDTSCGGDPIGTWKFSATCVTLPADLFVDPNNEALSMCKDITVAADLELTGMVTFNRDKTYSTNSQLGGTVAVSIPKSCLMGAPCDEEWSDAGDTCENMMAIDEEPNDETGTFEVMAKTFVLTDDEDGTEGNPTEFCVDGDTIRAKVVDDDGSVIIYTAERQ